MSDDPLLTSLCGICHIQEPKYKCPRCGAKTCSLACVKKHKNWSSCNGERDPTVFIPAAQLRTDRGIDHDYNFLHKLERTVDQVEKIFTEERGILPQRNQDFRTNKRARLHKGQSRGRNTLGEGLRPWARASISRLRKLGINVEHAPYGMSRARENKTSYNHKLRVINWQVEWLLLDFIDGPTRILSRTPDTTPLYTAFGDCQWHRLSKEERELEKRTQKNRLQQEQSVERVDAEQEHVMTLQDPMLGIWPEASHLLQDTTTARWNTTYAGKHQNVKEQGIRHDRNKYRFFLGSPKNPAREAKKLLPLVETEALETILRGEEVVEYPQIYVLPTNANLPAGYVLRQSKMEPLEKSKKRKHGVLVAYESGSESDSSLDSGPELEPSSKEEGGVRGDDQDNNNDGGDDDHDDHDEAEFQFQTEEQRTEFLAGCRTGGLTAEDTTSSSGSDSSDADDSDVVME
jgi:hypothetical protein